MRVFVIAGEPSGDKLGAALMAGLKELCDDVVFDGVGGPEMQAQGLVSRFPMDELSVMGLAEIVPKYRALMARIRETAANVIETQPDVLITIDSPDFSFRVAARVKAVRRGIRTVHYVAPSVWAWRPGRAKKISHFIDHVLAVLPFEPPFFTAHGIDCDFVGHPVVAEPRASLRDAQMFREESGIGAAPILLALPGSRKSEVARLAPVFGAAIARCCADRPDLRVVVPAAASVASEVEAAVRHWPGSPLVLDPRAMDSDAFSATKRAAFRAANTALAASGTVSLELAAARTPMVIAYRMQWLTFRLIRWMALIDTATLVNLVSETRTVPECLGPDCSPGNIAAALRRVMADPDAQLDAMEVTMQRLGEAGPPPGLVAARAVLARI